LSTSLVIGPDAAGRTVAIADGRVVAGLPKGAAHLACAGGLIEPGAVNAHTHLYGGLAPYGPPPPTPPPQTFVQMLERHWWRMDRALDAAMLRAAAEDYVAHALLAGTTALADHNESPSLIEGSLALIAEVCERLGVRALLCYGATERNEGEAEARRGLEECTRLAPSALVRPLIGLHASFTVSDASLHAAGRLAREHATVLHMHVAEDGADVADAIVRGYAGPLERLRALGALVPGSILAHGVHLSRAEAAEADALGCWLVHNPRSNEANRVGYAGALGASTRVALGTDGWDADMRVEEAALGRLAAAHNDTGTAGRLAAGYRLVAERFAAAATPLAPGALGDVVVRQDGAVRHVVVEGRVVVRDGRLLTGEAGAIEATARREAARLAARMGEKI
jgi:cytosine/adenosine deaminase-related metal-dependent hydrolase